MIRVFTVYTGEVDPERFAQHVEIARTIPGATVRHGPVVRTLFGEPLQYYAEFEFADMDALKAAQGTPEFKATGEDAGKMGVPHNVYIAEM
jgi:hypothetical protein